MPSAASIAPIIDVFAMLERLTVMRLRQRTITIYYRSSETTVVNSLHCATQWSAGDVRALRLRRLRYLFIRLKLKAQPATRKYA
jgi:hypothetical protein